jgi:hypothetical protein
MAKSSASRNSKKLYKLRQIEIANAETAQNENGNIDSIFPEVNEQEFSLDGIIDYSTNTWETNTSSYGGNLRFGYQITGGSTVAAPVTSGAGGRNHHRARPITGLYGSARISEADCSPS